MYSIYFYHNFGEPYYHSITKIQTDRPGAIQTARDYKNRHGDRGDHFEVFMEADGEAIPVYHSIFGAWDDPRLP
jgi:hypothetical protein